MSEDKRKHTFDAYHESRVANREALVRRALTLLSNARFDTLTALAKNVAKVVTELESRQAKDGEQPSEVAYTTLVRKGSKYKHILLAHFEGTHENEKSDEEAEIEELRLHTAHLEHENDLLRQRLSAVGSTNALETSSEALEGRFSAEDIGMLLGIIDRMKSDAYDIFPSVAPHEVNEDYPYPGLWGPSEQVAEWEDLERIGELKKEIGYS